MHFTRKTELLARLAGFEERQKAREARKEAWREYCRRYAAENRQGTPPVVDKRRSS